MATGIALPFPATSQTIPSTEAGQDSTTRQFNIPAQALSSALAQFGRQAGLQIAFAYETPSGMSSSPVSGTMSPQQALGQLLAGTGATWRIAQGTVVIELAREAALSGMTDFELDGDSVMLGTIIISGNAGGGFTLDTPYETAGSVSHISRETLDRVAPASAGDIFINTPGVISAGNRVGTSINPNIRGMQGMGRVKVTVDGAEQTTSTYRGYIGNRDEAFIDPDMISGVDITKGPSQGAGGGLGGSVAFRTLTVDDVLTREKPWGFRLRTGFGSNTTTATVPGTFYGSDRPGLFSGDSWSGSIAGAFTSEAFDFVAAYSRRVQGNYFVGTKTPPHLRFSPELRPNAIVRPGEEMFNTGEDTRSFLAKGTFRWGDGQSIELGFNRYDSRHGEISELLFGPVRPNQQDPDSSTVVNAYTVKYRWQPAGSDLIDFRTNLWLSDLDRESGDSHARASSIRSWGGDLSNSAVVDSAVGRLTFSTGIEFSREDTETPPFPQYTNSGELVRWESNGPSGERKTFGAWINVRAEVSPWLTLDGGLRYDSYESSGKGYLASHPDRSQSAVSPKLGITITPVEGLQFFALYTEGFRAPSLRETHWSNERYGLVANPDLRAERAKNIELGFNILRDDVFAENDSLRLKFSWFDNRYDDYIVRMPANGPLTGQPYHWGNLDRANYQGFELSGGYDTDRWFVEGSLTRYRSVEYCAAGGVCAPPGAASAGPLANDYMANYIPPKFSGSLTAGARFLDRKLTIGARAHFAGTKFGSSWSDAAYRQGQVGVNLTWPSYTVYDLFGSYKFTENTMVNFSIENITDEYYFGALASGSIPSPGRTARIALTHRF